MAVESLKRKKVIESIEIIELGLVRDRGSVCPLQLLLCFQSVDPGPRLGGSVTSYRPKENKAQVIRFMRRHL